MQRALFERLRQRSRPAGHSSQREADELRESICANLERILNSRSGMSMACPSYGIPDMTQIVHGIPERAREIEGALERCIREFEPRIAAVQVEHVEDATKPLTACFRMRVALADPRMPQEVWFDTVVVASGRVKLISR